jgi:hypothetical protein
MLETQPLLGGPIKDNARTVLIVASVVALVVGVIVGTFSRFHRISVQSIILMGLVGLYRFHHWLGSL